MTAKKTIIIASFLFVVLAVSASGWGIGVAAGIQPLGGLPGSNVMLSFQAPVVPILFGVGFAVGTETFNMGITADWWAVNPNIVGILNFYLGPGLYFGVAGDEIDLGGRIPVGLNIFPIPWLEIFIEIAPTLVVRFADPVQFPVFGLQSSLGLRFWFN